MCTRVAEGHHHRMTRGAALTWWSWSAPAVFLIGRAVSALAGLGPAGALPLVELVVTTALLLPSVLTGVLVAVRVPASPVGGALAWVGAAPAAVFAVEDWGRTAATDRPWPGATVAAGLVEATWPWLFLGFVALVLVFPDGLLPGRRWRVVAALAPFSAALLTAGMAFDASNFSTEGGPWPGAPLFVLPDPLRDVELVLVFGQFLAMLLAAASCLVVRFRRGGELTRLRVRWLMLAAGGVPVLLGASWVALLLGVPGEDAFTAFLVVLLVLMPAAVTIAILRHDLFDVDRLLGEGLAWFLTTVVSAGIFAAAVVALGELFGRGTPIGATGAAFVTALCLLPLHRVLVGLVGRFVDRDRHVVLVRVRQFVAAVRDGSAEPEAVEDLLRGVLGDPDLRLLLRRPGAPEAAFVDIGGTPATVDPAAPRVALRTGDAEVGVLVLADGSARRLRRARELAVEARLPIEVSRLRLELREALDDVRASRSRLAEAGEQERRRLERDLHDGAQQQILAVGMQLRSVQRRLDATGPVHRELDDAVDALEATVVELRRLAHGVRPARLDNGLAPALRDLVRHSTVPVDLDVADVDVPDLVATTVYFVVAEALANVHKHGDARQVHLMLANSGGTVRASVRDDGVGGATDGFGLTSLRDRVASAGGELWISSPVGSGTEVRVEVPCGS
jgi:signal transduction histidine kinase